MFSFIIGAQRSGTTMLATHLEMHSNVGLAHPIWPEPKYFIKEQNWSNPHFMAQHFEHCSKNTTHFIEKSTSYYEHPEALRRISDLNPESKFIFLLRNPAHRALSNFHFSKQYGLETRTLNEAFIQHKKPPFIPSDISVDPFDYLGRSHYAEHLSSMNRVIDKSKLLLLILEEELESPKPWNAVWEFIDIEAPSVVFNTKNRINSTRMRYERDEGVENHLMEYFKEERYKISDYLGRNVWENK